MKNYALISLLLLAALCAGAEEYWPQWRGPSHNGVSEAVDLPTTWSTSENVVWSILEREHAGGVGRADLFDVAQFGRGDSGRRKAAFGLLVNG